MSLTTLFERITRKQKQRQEARATDYRGLVIEIADGKEPAADRIEGLLAETGKSVAELRADVELFQRRRALRTQFDSLGSLQQERKAVENDIESADAVLTAAEDMHEQATTPLYARLDALKTAIREAQNARQVLQETCMISDLVHELDQIRDESRTANTRRAELQLRIKDARDQAASDLQEVKYAPSDDRQEALRQRSSKQSAKADELEKELASVLQRLESINHREREVLENMLVP